MDDSNKWSAAKPFDPLDSRDGRIVQLRGPWTIAGLGEVLWDIFPDGAKFGGAPANFACSAAGLAGDQANVFMTSGVGDDPLGRNAVAALQNRHVDTSHIQVSPQATGTVTIEIDPSGSAAYSFASDTAWDNLQWSDAWRAFAGRVDAVCFGTLGQRSDSSRRVVEQFLESVHPTGLRIFDINIRPPFFTHSVILRSLELANVLKLNEQELPLVAQLCGLQGPPVEQLRQLAMRYDLQCVALTLGADGALLVRGDETSEAKAVQVEVIDTVGAGDAFTAALTLGLLQQMPLPEINDWASNVAAHVCSQAGATPDVQLE